MAPWIPHFVTRKRRERNYVAPPVGNSGRKIQVVSMETGLSGVPGYHVIAAVNWALIVVKRAQKSNCK